MKERAIKWWNNALTDRRLFVFAAVTLLWVAVIITIGSDYPFHYDSVNYALGIADDFDIGKCQPHAYGYIYHILLSRIWLPVIDNPFRIQQVQNVLYFLLALVFMVPWRSASGAAILLLIPATLPLTLFLVATGMIHGVSFVASAVIALLVLKLEKREISPVVLAVVFAVVIGFRQDLAIFMGPVVFMACIRYRCSIRQWSIMLVSGAALTAVWYVGTSWSSGWLSPWKEANDMVKLFLPGTSILYGAPWREWLRIVLRLFLYIPAVLGPGGLWVIAVAWKKFDRVDRWYLAAAVVPFFMYGILLYLGMPNYYATIAGFVFAWILLRERLVLHARTVLLVVTVNLLFFLTVPAPLTRGYGDFSSRPIGNSILKQASYFGALGRAAVVRNRGFEKFLDGTVRKCHRFTTVGTVDYEGLPYSRIWKLLARRVWHNTWVPPDQDADCLLQYIGNGTMPAIQYDHLGVWYRNNSVDRATATH